MGDVDARLAALPPERDSETDELYLLAVDSEASVKVRDGLMDVKRLERVSDDGLEQFRPVLKAAFPIGEEDVRAMLDALGVPGGVLERDEYALDELVAEVVAPREDLIAVEVHKRRAHFTIGGCMVERSELRTDRGTARTVCVESEDPALVLATLRSFGLDPHANVSVPRQLQAMAGAGARRYAVIDVGTNSVKFRIEEHAADGSRRTVADRAEVTRLGQDLGASGQLGQAAIARTTEAIAGMADQARGERADAIAAVGTAGLRLAANAAELIDAVRERTGVEIEVISGAEEARLAYLGAISGLARGDGSLVVFDSGGGSSQFTIGRWDRVDESFSVDVGAVRLTERFRLDAVAAGLSRLDGLAAPETVVGMGGAVTNLAAVEHRLAVYDPDVVQGTILGRGEIDRQIELYRTMDADGRRQIVGLQPDRAEVILAGACIVRTVLAKLRCDALTVSDRGLRHGILAERFG
jgi:exopolyphosphatase / guanosine-5'-triphosphate,3'-diphosphate pyrophosphatase